MVLNSSFVMLWMELPEYCRSRRRRCRDGRGSL